MRFYRVSFMEQKDRHHGYNWYTSRREAELGAAEFRKTYADTSPDVDIEEVEIVPTKTGIRQALNRFASHNNNG